MRRADFFVLDGLTARGDGGGGVILRTRWI